jgi:hypothetical protein
MNRQPMLDSWASGELFGISEQFARAGIELSGISGWFAQGPGQLSGNSGYLRLAPAAQILPRGHRARHATGHLADATDELSRRPDHPAEPPSQSAGLTGRLAGLPGESSRRPSQLSRRPDESDGRPNEPEGPGAARRGGMAARRRPGVRALARAVFVPKGRRGVATGGASRSDAEPVGRDGVHRACPGGAEGSSPARDGRDHVNGCFLRPCRGGPHTHDAFHGLRDGQSTVAPPVATALDPSGVEDGRSARAGDLLFRAGEVPEAPPAARPSGISAPCRAGDRLFLAGEVPEGRHAPLALADLHAGGSGVRRG